MSVHVQPIVMTARFYDEDVKYNQSLESLENLPFQFTCTVQICGDKAFISAGLGEVKMSDAIQLRKILREKFNIKSISFDHKNTPEAV